MKPAPEVVGVVAVVVVTAVVSGPLVGHVDLTQSDGFDPATSGEGRVDVGNVSLPGSASIERGEFGSGSYYLRVPPATVELLAVEGRPILSYSIRIRALGFQRSSAHFLSADNEGEYPVTLAETTLAPDDIEDESYDGRLSLVVRSETGETTVATSNVTVQVES